MNYWPAGQTNIIETQDPLFDLFKVAHPRAQALARDMYNCSGIVIHHNLDLWGDPAPVDNYTSSSMWPMGAAWVVTHLVDPYRYTGDKKLLSEIVYPYLLDVVKFYQCYTTRLRHRRRSSKDPPRIHPPTPHRSPRPNQEWRLDYDLRTLGHRHLSPLFGLHPGFQFSPLLNETLSKAAEVLLDQRNNHGSGSTGWSNA
jgi:hypothetical protein